MAVGLGEDQGSRPHGDQGRIEIPAADRLLADQIATATDDCVIRPATPADRAAAYYVCLKTGDAGGDAEHLYLDDPDALGRVFVGPYLVFEPDSSFVLEDADGVCGYALAAPDSRRFYARYEREWRPGLCRAFPEPRGDRSTWSRAQHEHYTYHHPDYFCPEPYDLYPSHLHIDLLPRAQGRGQGRRMIETLIAALRRSASPGVHLGVAARNARARRFYERLGFLELTRTGSDADPCIYMGRRL